MTIARRDFLKALGAAGFGTAAAAMPGCATSGGGSGGRVVVVSVTGVSPLSQENI